LVVYASFEYRATAAAGASQGTVKAAIFATMPSSSTTLLDARAVDRTLKRMAGEIVELNDGTDRLILIGIQRRGVQLADRLAALIGDREGVTPPRGALDITLYRDDLQTIGPRPVVGATDLPWDIDGARVVIVDDVLYTGRTVRAALDELADFGRPARIALAVLVDRGGRELPIHADVVGKRIDLPREQRVDVLVEALDGRDAVITVTEATA
jgi:pyrimidine operon attenuation protein/uracil phosphoribosyltransferase